MSIPIVIGVTGHRNLRQEDIPALQKCVRTELTKLKTACPHCELVMLNSLAAGADCLCAEIALELGMELVCVFPMEAEEYRKDFSEADLVQFNALLEKARVVFVAPHTEKAEVTRDFCYRQAGLYVAAHSHVLLALWDGNPPKPGGCGTAEAVDFMLRGPGGFKASNDGAVLHIQTNRQGSGKILPIAGKLLENHTGCLAENLAMTDGFNADAQKHPQGEMYRLLPEECFTPRLARLENAYHQADSLSVHFQRRHLRSLGVFSLFSVLLVLTFLLYDEAGFRGMLLGYAAIVLVYLAVYFFSEKSRAHELYLQYRVLAESLRVQLYLTASGQGINVGESFTWTQKQESSWVKEALSALLIGGEEERKASDAVIKAHWIDGQLAYHQNALHRNQKAHRDDERWAKLLFGLSIVVLAVILGVEFFWPHMSSLILLGADFTVGSGLLVLLGVTSAGTGFLSSYYGKLTLERKCADSEKMILLYTAAREQFDDADHGALFRELAREEIIENGNWFSYCHENRPTFDI